VAYRRRGDAPFIDSPRPVQYDSKRFGARASKWFPACRDLTIDSNDNHEIEQGTAADVVVSLSQNVWLTFDSDSFRRSVRGGRRDFQYNRIRHRSSSEIFEAEAAGTGGFDSNHH